MIRHIPRSDGLTKNVTEGDVEEYIGRGRPRMEYMEQITMDMGRIATRI
jgi:hypothetical protein